MNMEERENQKGKEWGREGSKGRPVEMLVVATGGPLMLLGISPPSQEKNRERGGGRGMDGGKGGYWSAVEALK